MTVLTIDKERPLTSSQQCRVYTVPGAVVGTLDSCSDACQCQGLGADTALTALRVSEQGHWGLDRDSAAYTCVGEVKAKRQIRSQQKLISNKIGEYLRGFYISIVNRQ